MNLMQNQIKSNPHSALMIKTAFKKISSIVVTPLFRIMQADSPDDRTVSKYYSNELIKFVKEVLQIIPITVFENLQQLIVLLNT